MANRLDRRLAGLATSVGARYTRYADDLVFSGDAGLPAHGLIRRVSDIATEEGFRTRPDKTRILPAHHRQRVTGLVVNTRPAVARPRVRRPVRRNPLGAMSGYRRAHGWVDPP